MSDLVKRLRIKAGMIEMGERIAWGSDSALMREAADELEMTAPAVQGELDVEYGPTPGCKQCEEAMSINLDSCPECDAEFCAPQPAQPSQKQQETTHDAIP